MERQFPRLEINLPHLQENTKKVVDNCRQRGIQVCGVIKGCNGMPEIAALSGSAAAPSWAAAASKRSCAAAKRALKALTCCCASL